MDPAGTSTVFLLSPADVNGRRAEHITRRGAKGALAQRYRNGDLEVQDAYAYISALYFRGKLAYARAFGAGRESLPDALVIVPGYGLVPFGWILDQERVRRIRRTELRSDCAAYVRPLQRDVRRLAEGLREGDRVILLGSVATGKYVDVLAPLLGPYLRFPAMFVGTGDMRRGAMMLNAVRNGAELEYAGIEAERSTAVPRISLRRGAGLRGGVKELPAGPGSSATARRSTNRSRPTG